MLNLVCDFSILYVISMQTINLYDVTNSSFIFQHLIHQLSLAVTDIDSNSFMYKERQPLKQTMKREITASI